MKTLEDKLAAARQVLLEMEARDSANNTLLRKMFGEMEEELRTLRAEQLKKQIEIFTEKEFAEKLKVSVQTIARERQAGRIQPIELGDTVHRYSSLQLEQVHQIFANRRRGPKPKKREYLREVTHG